MNRILFNTILTAIIILCAANLFAEDRTRDACLEYGYGYVACDMTTSVCLWASQGQDRWICLSIGFGVATGSAILWNEGQNAEEHWKRKKANRLDERQIIFGAACAVITNILTWRI